MTNGISFLGLLMPAVIYGSILTLHVFLPARRIPGYVIDPQTRQPQVYRLNGLLVLSIMLGCFALATAVGWTDLAGVDETDIQTIAIAEVMTVPKTAFTGNRPAAESPERTSGSSPTAVLISKYTGYSRAQG